LPSSDKDYLLWKYHIEVNKKPNCVILNLVTGFGITEFRIVEAITLGLLTKPLAFRMHDSLLLPFAVLPGLHIFLSLNSRLRTKV
jgi:hypothetical protein